MRKLTQTLFLASMVSVTFHCRAQSPELATSRDATVPVQIPFHLEDGYLIVVKGRIASIDHLNFVLDSGATDTVLDLGIAKKIGSSGLRGGMFHFDRVVTTEWVTATDLQLGPIRIPSARYATLDLSRESFPFHADAIIGLDVLRQAKLSIDYKAKIVSLKWLGPALSGLRSKMAAVEITAQGRPLIVLLDTGAQGLVLFKDRVAGHVPRIVLKDTATWSTATGEIRVQHAQIPEMRLGSLALDQDCVLINSSRAPAGVDGYLGISSLHASRVDFDFVYRTLHWNR